MKTLVGLFFLGAAIASVPSHAEDISAGDWVYFTHDGSNVSIASEKLEGAYLVAAIQNGEALLVPSFLNDIGRPGAHGFPVTRRRSDLKPTFVDHVDKDSKIRGIIRILRLGKRITDIRFHSALSVVTEKDPIDGDRTGVIADGRMFDPSDPEIVAVMKGQSFADALKQKGLDPTLASGIKASQIEMDKESVVRHQKIVSEFQTEVAARVEREAVDLREVTSKITTEVMKRVDGAIE